MEVMAIARPEPLLVPLPLPDEPVFVGVTEATEPMVAEGTGPSPPLIATDSEESVAKPTEAGDERKTEYTFFCGDIR